MIEAELKAEITSLDVNLLKCKLSQYGATPQNQVYSDVYFTKDSCFEDSEQELRIRTVYSGKSIQKQLLTYKSKPLDSESKSKEETEINISDSIKMQEILLSLGFRVKVKFQKVCENYRIRQFGRDFLITLVSFAEEKEKFIEIETLTNNKSELFSRLSEIKQIFSSLQIPHNLITNKYYTDLCTW